MKKQEKTNIEFLRDIITEVKKEEFGSDQFEEKMSEAAEFLDAIEDEQKELVNENKDLTEKVENFDEDDEDEDEDVNFNSDFVGLDTIEWRLVNGNLKIQQQMENILQRLKQQNGATVA